MRKASGVLGLTPRMAYHNFEINLDSLKPGRRESFMVKFVYEHNRVATFSVSFHADSDELTEETDLPPGGFAIYPGKRMLP
jgi:hypothetical protein